tara:strand:+ start:93 stop:3521 length:3429 start_codon:yes stop_codon:yes gene_type:complete
MKILKDITEYIKYSIDNKNIELEFIYGYNKQGDVNKETFLKVLDYCKKQYKFVNETNILDIRKEIIIKNKKNISNIRCSINGINNIQKYCKTNKIQGDHEYIKKQIIKELPKYVNNDYNYRINIKSEEELKSGSADVNSFNVDIDESNKHFRYKKRYSFNLENDLFRIDLTVVKNSKYNEKLRSYELHKTFMDSKILKQPEMYEIEIEYIGNNSNFGKKNLTRYVNNLKNEGELESGTIYQPLDPSLNYIEEQKEEEVKIENIIGEYVTISDEYLKTQDKEIYKKLSGKSICYVTDLMVIGDLTYTILDIKDMEQMIVSITDVYNEQWNSGEYERKINIKPTDDLLNKINKVYNDIIYDIISTINSTKILLSKTKQKEILENYYVLTNQTSKYKKVFMAPQPVTLNLYGLYSENSINILENYAVTEKADGIRYLLYIDKTKRGYLINTKLDVILDTGIEFKNIKGEWLLDGEYIQKDKNNIDIQLFMIFDVYYCEEELYKNAYVLPFEDEDICRNKLLKFFESEYIQNLEIMDKDYNVFRIHNKRYEYNNILNKSDEINKNILLKSKLILDKSKNDGYEYSIDGLIYLPLKLPVKSKSDGKPVKFINGTWEHNFKWKPPEENTIDFQISMIKQTINKKSYNIVKDKMFPYNVFDSEGNSTVEYYKQAKLLVTYDETKDYNLEYYLKILEQNEQNNSKYIVFNPPDVKKDYGKTNIKLTDGKMLCLKDEREIQDGDIVEMKFNEIGEHGFNWIPLKLRSDKLNPQWFLAANNVWSTIVNPVNESMVCGNIDLDNIKNILPDADNSGLYYVEENDNKTSEPLRKFHNFIKYYLITGICYGKDVNIMDTSIGRGGDIKKYIQLNFRCKFLLGLDLNSINESSRRYYYLKSKKPKAVFLRYNTSKNIEDGDGVYNNIPDYPDNDIEHSETMINILYGKGGNIPSKYKTIRETYNKKCLQKFDLISCQFSLHYYFESADTLNGFLTNLRDNCKSGGYFIGTCYDGKRLFELMKGYTQIDYRDKFDNLVYSIKKKYDIESFDDNIFGNEIDVYMESIGEEYTEYLVNFDKFVEIMKENGFELYKPDIKPEFDIFDGPLNSFSTIIKKLNTFKKNKNFMKYYKESLDMLKDEKLTLLSSLNNFFIFKKK